MVGKYTIEKRRVLLVEMEREGNGGAAAIGNKQGLVSCVVGAAVHLLHAQQVRSAVAMQSNFFSGVGGSCHVVAGLSWVSAVVSAATNHGCAGFPPHFSVLRGPSGAGLPAGCPG
jgi:hypothetical protein